MVSNNLRNNNIILFHLTFPDRNYSNLLADIIAAPNVVLAIVLGGASGLAATGTNQVIKQLKK